VENGIGLKIGLSCFPLLLFKYHNKWKILADIWFDIMESFPCIGTVRHLADIRNLQRGVNALERYKKTIRT